MVGIVSKGMKDIWDALRRGWMTNREVGLEGSTDDDDYNFGLNDGKE